MRDRRDRASVRPDGRPYSLQAYRARAGIKEVTGSPAGSKKTSAKTPPLTPLSPSSLDARCAAHERAPRGDGRGALRRMLSVAATHTDGTSTRTDGSSFPPPPSSLPAHVHSPLPLLSPPLLTSPLITSRPPLPSSLLTPAPPFTSSACAPWMASATPNASEPTPLPPPPPPTSSTPRVFENYFRWSARPRRTQHWRRPSLQVTRTASAAARGGVTAMVLLCNCCVTGTARPCVNATSPPPHHAFAAGGGGGGTACGAGHRSIDKRRNVPPACGAGRGSSRSSSSTSVVSAYGTTSSAVPPPSRSPRPPVTRALGPKHPTLQGTLQGVLQSTCRAPSGSYRAPYGGAALAVCRT